MISFNPRGKLKMFTHFAVVKLIDKAEVTGDHRQQAGETEGITLQQFYKCGNNSFSTTSLPMIINKWTSFHNFFASNP